MLHVEGRLAPKVLSLTVEWASLHQVELLDNWELCGQHHQPKRIQPLD
jgi:hypothetical protein